MSDSSYYDRFNSEQQPAPKKEKRIIASETGYSLAKIFLYMFIGLVITSAIALGLGAVFNYVLLNGMTTEEITTFEATGALIVLITLIASGIGLIVLSIVVPITVARGRHSVLVPMIIYTILMGVMLSTITMFVPWYLLGLTFGITSLMFGLMSLIALLSKSRLNGLAIVAIGLFAGAGLIALAMWILILVGVNVTWLYWVVSLATFAAMMLITIWDIARIKHIAEGGAMTNNLSLYCAFILYNDFIYILLRVLRIVLMVMGKKN